MVWYTHDGGLNQFSAAANPVDPQDALPVKAAKGPTFMLTV